VLGFGKWQLLGMEEVPYRSVDYLIGRVAEDVND